MAFNVDTYIEALEPPTLIINGRTYTGRHLSHEEFERLRPLVAQQGEAGLTPRHIRELTEAFCSRAFPRPWWAFWRPNVTKLVLQLPIAARLAALTDFLACQARAMGMTAPVTERPGAAPNSTVELRPST